MKRIQTIACAVALALTLAMFSCNDPLQIGTELLEGGDVNFVSTDTISITALTTQLDSVIAYRNSNIQFSVQKLGWVNDPILGSHRSDLFVQILPSSFTRPVGLVDSVVLQLQYDTSAIYGDTNAMYGFEAFALSGGLSRLDTRYVGDELPISTSLGVINGYKPSEADSIEIVSIKTNGDLDTTQILNSLRFPLDNSFGELLMNIDSADYAVADSFLTAFNGILIRPTLASGGMLPIRLPITNSSVPNCKVSVFYKDDEGLPQQFNYPVAGANFSLHDHDYSSGVIAGAIDSEVRGEELLYLQGAGGPSISVKFPYIESFSNIVVNQAILELTTTLLPMDDRSLYPLPSQLYTVYKQDSTLVLTSDISTALQTYRDVSLSGGVPEEVTTDGTTSIVYKFNISSHIQDMIKGSVSDELFIQSSQTATGVERAIFKGFNNPDCPVKLKITYTEI